MPASEVRETGKDSRTLILHVALHLFNQRGYDGTSIDDIRQAAGFKSKASLYTHFKSKDEVAQALLHRILKDEEQIIAAVYDPNEPDSLTQLGCIGRAFVKWGMTHPAEYAFCFLRIQQETVIGGQRNYLAEPPDAPTLRFLTQLIGDLRADYPVRIIEDAALMSMVGGVISKAVIDQGAFGAISLEQKIDQVMDICAGVLFSEAMTFPK